MIALSTEGDMAVTIEMQNTGDSRAHTQIHAGIEHVLGDVAGQSRVSICRVSCKRQMENEGGATPGTRAFVYSSWRSWRAPA